jgi:hypothetical protein
MVGHWDYACPIFCSAEAPASAFSRFSIVAEKAIELDQHRGMAAQKATDLRRLLADVKANESALRLRQDELEAHLLAAPAANWREASDKARYLLGLFAASIAAQAPQTEIDSRCPRWFRAARAGLTGTPKSSTKREMNFPKRGMITGCTERCMSARRRTKGWKSNWGLMLAALAAVAFIAAGMAYKFTGDFTGLATFGTSGRQQPQWYELSCGLLAEFAATIPRQGKEFSMIAQIALVEDGPGSYRFTFATTRGEISGRVTMGIEGPPDKRSLDDKEQAAKNILALSREFAEACGD